ncbi:MAG: trigger factor family protein, partial [Chitinophagia bacterium]|nr:trigger factor family protein [Chitinophagia bacterium]
MATITRENLGAYHAKITVKLEKFDYLPAYEKSLKQFAKTANVPGFRKGMIPAGIVKKMAGQNMFHKEIVNAAGSQLENYLRRERIALLGQPMPLNTGAALPDMNLPTDTEISFEIGVKPDFEIPALQHPHPMTAYRVLVNDTMLNDEMERIRRRFGNIEPKEVLNDREDVVIGNFEPCNAEGASEGEQLEETTIVLGALPVKLQEMLQGKQAGDTVIFDPRTITTQEEFGPFIHEGLKTNDHDLHGHYKFTISKTGMLVAMDMGFELYEKVFPNTFIAGETDFREKVQAYGKELEQRQKEKEVDEGLDANQKRVGQLG